MRTRLADAALPDRSPTMPNRIPEIGGHDLNTKENICALSSWFLATVIMRSQRWVLKQEAMRAKGRDIQWSANVGVPVEYCDSPAIDVFKEVLVVAWTWANSDDMPTQLDKLLTRYIETSQLIVSQTTDCHAMAEIAAAVQSFVTSRQAVPGIYVYFDVGGGTLDGVAFNYVNPDGERRINFYSGRVAALGIAALSRRFGDAEAGSIESALIKNGMVTTLRSILEPLQKDIELLVANVVMTAKRKDGRNWQRNAIQDTLRFRKHFGRLDANNMAPLLVFIEGGGASSEWYRSAILETHADFGHLNAGVPPYELIAVGTRLTMVRV